MSTREKKPQAAPASVPSYIVTFSDMVTLLLTFFVLLLSMSTDSDPVKYKVGQQAFKRSLENFGLRGILYTLSSSKNFSQDMMTYPIDNKEDEQQLTPTNTHEEQIRRIFTQINQNMKVRPSQIKGKLLELLTPRITFNSSSSELTNEHENRLSEICTELTLTANDSSRTIYVVGLAPDQYGQDKWVIAAKRAKNAADFLESKLPPGSKVYSWGTADPSEWITSSGAKDVASDIIISVLDR